MVAVLVAAPLDAQQPTTPAADAALMRRANALHRAVPLIDGHNDLPWELREKAAGDLARMDPNAALPGQHTDIPRLRQGGVGGVFWAAYVPVEMMAGGATRFTLDQIDLIHRMTERSAELEFARTAADIERIHRRRKIASLIGIEGGHALENSLGALRQFYDLGVRYLTLTHSSAIDWADAATDAPRHGGLSPFGEEVVREMNRLGMMIDLSHVSDETMRDAIRVSEAPVIFSHSSARAIADHPRNVPDDVLRLVKQNDGIVMVNFYSGFVEPTSAERTRTMLETQRELRQRFAGDSVGYRAAWGEWRRANPMARGSVATIADHIDHIVKTAGIDHVGIGSDYDGVSLLPEGLDDVAALPNLTVELLRRGYSDRDVKKILGENFLRVMKDVERTAARLQKERGPSTATIEALQGRSAAAAR
jgi:membrane dipeptidase